MKPKSGIKINSAQERETELAHLAQVAGRALQARDFSELAAVVVRGGVR